MAHILLVDDDAALLDVLALAFQDAGHRVSTSADGVRALDVIRQGDVEGIVSDVNMPHMDGFALCRKLRAENNAVPIVLLTSRDSEIDEALGLDLGADDYVTKPFSTRILLARVHALLRRQVMREAKGAEATTLHVGDLSLDTERLEARLRGVLVSLTLTEFRLTEALVRRPGIVLSRERLLDLVRGDESVVVERIVDTYVARLRRKFERVDATFGAIETVVGAGYRWRAP